MSSKDEENKDPITEFLGAFGFTPEGLGLFFLVGPFIAVFLGPYMVGVLFIIVARGFVKTVLQMLKK